MKKAQLLPELSRYLADLTSEFANIPEERKTKLEKISAFISMKTEKEEAVLLTFICTHNSRRSHMSQLMAQAAASYYGIENVFCYSGGTESTAFNSRSVQALQQAGFEIVQQDNTENPRYLVKYAENSDALEAFSKIFSHPQNPQQNFAAIMTCSAADEACPFVPGAAVRIAIPYEDPKDADNTPEEKTIYDERCRQIAMEMMYAFSSVI